MKNLIYPGYLLLLYLKITWAKVEKKPITLHVDDLQPHALTSPNFPSCCEPIQYLLVSDIHNQSFPSNWRLLFTDLDIPPGSELLIYGYKERYSEKKPLDSPKYSPDGAWLRPAIIYQGYGLGIEFSPIKSDSKRYVGFNATYWLTPEKGWTVERPFTVCPTVGDIMEGGVLEVAVFVQVRIHHYRFFCTWQLKPPPSQDLRMYINIYAAEDSNVKIRQGTHSGNPLYFEMHTLDMPVKLPKRLTSDHGLFIELDKPSDSGNFTFVYGVYKTVGVDEVCEYRIDKENLQGFRCQANMSSWCIPEESKCNGIKDCPDGEDEEENLCRVIVTTPAPTNKCPWHQCDDGKCRTYMERCPEEGCPKYAPFRCPETLQCINKKLQSCPGEKKCSYLERYCELKKECIMIYETCEKKKETCDLSNGKKSCLDGTCKRYNQRCPEDSCRSYKPNKCGAECYYDHERCNGIVDCLNGSDEADCYGLSTTAGVLIAKIVVGLVIICALCCSCKKRCGPPSRTRPAARDSSERLMPGSGNHAPHNNNNTPTARTFVTDAEVGYATAYNQNELNATTDWDPPPSYNEVMASDNETNELPPPPEYGTVT